MTDDPAVLTGEHFMPGDHAIAEGALAAGCRFLSGYPITPSTEVAERMAERLPEIGGRYVQMEDELASMAVILGAAWTGARTMTATSGTGFSLIHNGRRRRVQPASEGPAALSRGRRGGASHALRTAVDRRRPGGHPRVVSRGVRGLSRGARGFAELRAGEERALFQRFLEIEDGHHAIVQAELDAVQGLGYWFDVQEFKLEAG